MGLDMNLEGRKTFLRDYQNEENDTYEEGVRLSGQVFDLGYWRKHPNLHGYIIDTFAGGVDECQDIYLTEANLGQIIQAVKDDALPVTSGFFFGESQVANDQNTIGQLENAIEWVRGSDDDKRVWREVVYSASW